MAMTEASSSPSVLNLDSLDQLELLELLELLETNVLILPPPQHNISLDWYSITDSRTFPNSKKKYETGCYTQNPKTVIPSWVLPLFSLGYPGLWDCSPFLMREVPPGVWLKDTCKHGHRQASQAGFTGSWIYTLAFFSAPA